MPIRFTLRAAAAILGLVLIAGLAKADEAVFVSGFEDLPLMPGLVEDSDQSMNFDTPSGRIIEAVASGSVSESDVMAFYEATLPELGWRRVGEGRFSREGEMLRLEFLEDGKGVVVRFASSPEEGA